MRILVLALLVANLAFFAWSRWIDQAGEAGSAGPAAGAVPVLELAGATAPTAAASSPAATMRCRSIGPFVDAAAAAAAENTLHTRGARTHQRSVSSSVPDGYWVYIGEIGDAAARRRVIARLNQAGIHDAAPTGSAETADRVSIGLFNDQTHAVRRAEQVRQLGFKPVLDLHQRTISSYWVDVELKALDPDPQPAQLEADAPSGQPRLDIADCPVKG
jgi:hypothetical protein